MHGERSRRGPSGCCHTRSRRRRWCRSRPRPSTPTLMPEVHMLALVLPAVAVLWWDARQPSRGKLLAITALFAVGWTLRSSGGAVLALAAACQLARRNLRALLPLAALFAAMGSW